MFFVGCFGVVCVFCYTNCLTPTFFTQKLWSSSPVSVKGHWTCASTHVTLRLVFRCLLIMDCLYPRDLPQPARRKKNQDSLVDGVHGVDKVREWDFRQGARSETTKDGISCTPGRRSTARRKKATPSTTVALLMPAPSRWGAGLVSKLWLPEALDLSESLPCQYGF